MEFFYVQFKRKCIDILMVPYEKTNYNYFGMNIPKLNYYDFTLIGNYIISLSYLNKIVNDSNYTRSYYFANSTSAQNSMRGYLMTSKQDLIMFHFLQYKCFHGGQACSVHV